MFRRGLTPPDPFFERGALESAQTQDSVSLKTLASMGPLVIFLLPALDRARPWLEAIARARLRLETEGRRLVLVHTGTDGEAGAVFAGYDLSYVARVADPDRALYRHFELGTKKRLLGKERQLPGIVWLDGGEVRRVERPDWDQSSPMGLIDTN